MGTFGGKMLGKKKRVLIFLKRGVSSFLRIGRLGLFFGTTHPARRPQEASLPGFDREDKTPRCPRGSIATQSKHEFLWFSGSGKRVGPRTKSEVFP
jgi:hypothetical protein